LVGNKQKVNIKLSANHPNANLFLSTTQAQRVFNAN